MGGQLSSWTADVQGWQMDKQVNRLFATQPWKKHQKKGLHRVWENQGALKKKGLLEQDGTGQNVKRFCLNAITWVILLRKG